jgi:light-regulated signal transduction histidine kinase (bacteriophytochrome)
LDALLDFSLLNTRQSAFEKIDLQSVISSILDEFHDEMEETGARVHVPDLPSITGDSEQIRLAFFHIIQNGLEYKRQGIPANVRLSWAAIDEVLKFTVSDNGIGIDENQIEDTFRPLQRLVDPTAYPGIGMGLCLAKKIILRHGGDIAIESELGVGTRVILMLPNTIRRGS